MSLRFSVSLFLNFYIGDDNLVCGEVLSVDEGIATIQVMDDEEAEPLYKMTLFVKDIQAVMTDCSVFDRMKIAKAYRGSVEQ